MLRRPTRRVRGHRRAPDDRPLVRPGDRCPPTPGLVASTGAVVELGDGVPRGTHGRLLVFLPFASSPVCTREVQDLRDRHGELRAQGLEVVAVTCDALPALAAWERAEALPFPVLSDFWPHGAAASAWGVLDRATGAPRRTTFLVDADGVVRWRDDAPPAGARSVDDALGAARDLLRSPPPGL